MNRIIYPTIIFSLILVGCSKALVLPTEVPLSKPTSTISETATLTPGPSPIAHPVSSAPDIPTFLPTITNTPRPTPTPTATPAPSPTGFGGYQWKLFAFQKEYYGDIFISLINGENEKDITGDLPGLKLLKSWSRDGKWILFLVTKPEAKEISSDTPFSFWISSSDGLEKTKLWDVPANTYGQIEWFPDLTQFISFCSINGSIDLCLANTTDWKVEYLGVLEKLVVPGNGGEWKGVGHLTISPDGEKVAWMVTESSMDNYSASMRIYSFKTKTLENIDLTGKIPRGSSISYIWLPHEEGFLVAEMKAPPSGDGTIFYHVDREWNFNKIKESKENFRIISYSEETGKVFIGTLIWFKSPNGYGSRGGRSGFMDLEANQINLLKETDRPFSFCWLTNDGLHLLVRHPPENQLLIVDVLTGEVKKLDLLGWFHYNGSWDIQP